MGFEDYVSIPLRSDFNKRKSSAGILSGSVSIPLRSDFNMLCPGGTFVELLCFNPSKV